MYVEPLIVQDAKLIKSPPVHDERGYFGRLYSEDIFTKQGLNKRWVQTSKSFNRNRGSIRGMHFQTGKHAEAKLVSCLVGSIHDVIIDLRPESPTYRYWMGVELSEDNHWSLYIPPGCAHGYQTLRENALIYYQMSEFYEPAASAGIRWNDPAFGIEWPLPELAVLSQKDQQWPDYQGR